jgi:O-succinylhomoserine sulfhydrylase
MDPKKNNPAWHPDTLAVRAGTERSQFGEHSEALFLSSSFVFESAAQAAERFAGTQDGYIYSRFTNPTTEMLQQRLAALEGAQACIVTASGMSAITGTCLSLLKQGDHIIAATALFGATTTLFTGLFARLGIETTFVSLTDNSAFERAIKPNTKLIYIESPANPLTEIGDIPAIAAVSKKAGVILIVDNCFASPSLQQPIALGADIVVHSGTKYIDGQGRVLAGVVCGSEAFIHDTFFNYLRVAGPTLSAFNSWLLLKRVFYPGLPSHPQFALAQRQQTGGGGMIAVELHGSTPEQMRQNAWRLIDQCKIWSITGNLGDARSTITHPATTTHARVGEAARAAAGITEGMVRLSVGLEFAQDLIADLEAGLKD